MKEDAVDPSFFNFFLETWKKRLIWCRRLQWVAAGCISILQAAPIISHIILSQKQI
jgi:hypothetical protein